MLILYQKGIYGVVVTVSVAKKTKVASAT